ncbi:unnamed protein product [Caenorhabditis nigoni]
MHVLSYPVLSCILENIEANRRSSVSARCPEISRFEKTIPLRVNEIVFMKYTLRINNNEYSISMKVSKLRDSDRMSTRQLILQFRSYKCFSSVERNISRNYGVEEVERKIVEYVLGGRNNIRVQCLTVCGGYETMQYLFGLSNMKVNVLHKFGMGLPTFDPLIKSPLKELHFQVSDPADFEHPLAKTAEKIEIMGYGYMYEPDYRLETHRNLPNKEVVVDTIIRGLTDISILELIEYWRETGKAIGSSFSIIKAYGDSIEMFLEKVKERFQGTYEELKDTDDRKVHKINVVSIDVDSESKIVVYGGKALSGIGMYPKVVIKVMAVGSSAEIEEIMEPLEESKVVPRKPSNYLTLLVIPLLVLFITISFVLMLELLNNYRCESH